MSEKPQKRLVGWSVYLQTLFKRAAFRSVASGIGCGGVLLILLIIVACIRSVISHQALNQPLSEFIFPMAAGCGFGIMALCISRGLFQEAKQIEPVALVTRHNTGHLPAVETLVRPSDLPPSHQQAELLRAAKPGQETPAEELLRASVTQREE